MSGIKISSVETASEAISIVWQGRQLVLMLIAFLTAVTLLFMWPTLDWYVLMLTDFSGSLEPDPAMMQEIMDDMGYLMIAYIPFIFFMLAPMVVWSRATTGGPGVALAGGFGALLNRTLWLVWRYICMIGWALLLGSGLLIIFMVIEMLFGVSGSMASGDPSQMGDMMIILLPLYVLFLAVITGLTLLFSISMHGEVWDVRTPLYKTFGYMKGNLLGATGLLFAGMLLFYIAYSLLAMMVVGAILSASTWLTIVGLFFLFAVGNIYNFVWISYGALYASKVVPELKR